MYLTRYYRIRIIYAILSLLAGVGIYVFCRPHDQYIYTWIPMLNFHTSTHFLEFTLPDWILYSLPDGLWLLSYILIIQTIFPYNTHKQFLYGGLAFLISCTIEVFQFLSIVPGTGDWRDFIAYSLPITYLIYINLKQKNHVKN